MASLSLSTYKVTENATDVAYSKAFMVYIESHMAWLREHPTTTVVDIVPHLATKNAGNLYSYLVDIQFNMRWAWVVLRVNSMHSPLDFTGDETQLMIPSVELLQNLHTRFTARRERN